MTTTEVRDARAAGRDGHEAVDARSIGVGFALVTAAVYAIGAGRALDYDGSVTVGVFVRHGALLDVFRTVYSFNNHPYFSFVEHLVWDAGGHTEAWLRVVPIACGALAVGILAWWLTRRFGLVAGVVGGAVLAANPMFSGLSRSVRGYSLMTLGCVVATALFVDARDRGWTMSRGQSVLYVVALGVAVGTQSYAAIVVGAHVATLWLGGRFDPRWRHRFEGVVAIGVLPYAPMLRQLIDVGRGRHGLFQPHFPLDVVRALLGQQELAVVLLVVTLLIGLRPSTHSSILVPAFIVVAALLASIWIVLHPLDLYPRFLVWLVPAVAFGVARSIANKPALAVLAAVAVVAMIAAQIGGWTEDPIASRAVAEVVTAARGDREVPCAAGYSGEMLLGYVDAVRSVATSEQLGRCALLVADVDTSGPEIRALSCNFAHRQVFAGLTPMVVYSSRVSTVARRCGG